MPGRRSIILTAILSFCFGSAGSMVTIAALKAVGAIPPPIASVDLTRILDARKARFAEKIKSLQRTDRTETLLQAGAEVNAYVENLQAELARQGQGRIVLVKDAVVAGEANDITPEIESKLQR